MHQDVFWWFLDLLRFFHANAVLCLKGFGFTPKVSKSSYPLAYVSVSSCFWRADSFAFLVHCATGFRINQLRQQHTFEIRGNCEYFSYSRVFSSIGCCKFWQPLLYRRVQELSHQRQQVVFKLKNLKVPVKRFQSWNGFCFRKEPFFIAFRNSWEGRLDFLKIAYESGPHSEKWPIFAHFSSAKSYSLNC